MAAEKVRHGMFFRFGVHVSPAPREAPRNPRFACRCTPVQALGGVCWGSERATGVCGLLPAPLGSPSDSPSS